MNISESDTIYTSGKFNDNILTICISVLICDMTFQGLINKKYRVSRICFIEITLLY